MDFLPLHLIFDSDHLDVDKHVIELSKLHRLGFPVAVGLVVFPPKKLEGSRPGLELEKEVAKRGKDPEKIWEDLVNVWNNQKLKDPKKPLKAEVVFFVQKIKASGASFYDKKSGKIIIENEFGDLDSLKKYELAELVDKIEKKTVISQKYHWIYDKKGFKFVKISPALDELFVGHKMGLYPLGVNSVKGSHLKVFVKQRDLVIDPHSDGVIFIKNPEEDFDQEVFRLAEVSMSVNPKNVIYKMESEQDYKSVLFARHKKNLLNISILLSGVGSVSEFLEIKRGLLSVGLSRRGSFKLWLEFGELENCLNVDEYIQAGLDGVVFDLDKLIEGLGGQNDGGRTLVKFLQAPLKMLSRAGIPVMIEYKKDLLEEYINEFFEKGVWGVILDPKKASFKFEAGITLPTHL